MTIRERIRRMLRPHSALAEQNARIDELERDRGRYLATIDAAFDAIPLEAGTIGLDLPAAVAHLATAWESARETCDALKAEADRDRRDLQTARDEVSRLQGEASRLRLRLAAANASLTVVDNARAAIDGWSRKVAEAVGRVQPEPPGAPTP